MGELIFYLTTGDDFLADVVATRLRRDGHDVVPATTTEHDGRIRRGAYSVAVVDAWHPGAWAVCDLIKTVSPRTRVLVLQGGNVGRPDQFRVGGDASLTEPFEVQEVVGAVAALVTLSGRSLTASFPTRDEYVERARELLGRLLDQVAGLDESGRFHLHTAFGEAIGNAALHGNRSRRDRLVSFIYHDDAGQVVLRVTDEGAGFDWQTELEQRSGDGVELARDREGEGKMGGLGLNLMLKVCDRVRFNETGNEITLTKRVAAAKPAAG